MRYASNLTAPDLAPHFALRNPPIQLLGHDVPSDPDFEPECGYWTHDEAAILFTVSAQLGGQWLDIGARFGWTGAHIMQAGASVVLNDQDLFGERNARLVRNLAAFSDYQVVRRPSREFLRWCEANSNRYRGFVIDACHDAPEPLEDAKQCHALAEDRAVILLHDAWGWPVQDGAQWLLDQGWRVRLYNTPNGVLLCWRGAFTPPDHVPDPAVNWEQQHTRVTHLDLARCE